MIKAIFNSELFKAALSSMEKIVPKGISIIEEYDKLLFNFKENELILSAARYGEYHHSIIIPYTSIEYTQETKLPLNLLVQAHKFISVVKSLEDKEIKLKTNDNNDLMLFHEHGKYTFETTHGLSLIPLEFENKGINFDLSSDIVDIIKTSFDCVLDLNKSITLHLFKDKICIEGRHKSGGYAMYLECNANIDIDKLSSYKIPYNIFKILSSSSECYSYRITPIACEYVNNMSFGKFNLIAGSTSYSKKIFEKQPDDIELSFNVCDMSAAIKRLRKYVDEINIETQPIIFNANNKAIRLSLADIDGVYEDIEYDTSNNLNIEYKYRLSMMSNMFDGIVGTYKNPNIYIGKVKGFIGMSSSCDNHKGNLWNILRVCGRIQ